MDMLTFNQVWEVFENIRRAQMHGKYSPHKPLLILLALSRIQKGLPRQSNFTEIDAPLKGLLTEFGPSSAAKSRHYPFWHLATDAQGGLWEISGPSELLTRPAGLTPNLSELRDPQVKAGFSEPIYQALKNTPGLLETLAQHILLAYFSATITDDIAATLGLSLDPIVAASVSEALPAPYLPESRKKRDPGFRERVLRAYEFRCCICGFDLRIGSMSAGLEAGHIQWHMNGGPDIETNGLALCALHHKLFDLGVFTLEPYEHRVVFSQHAIGGNRNLDGELRHHGSKMLSPQQTDQKPAPEFLEWNLNNIFKKPARQIVKAP